MYFRKKTLPSRKSGSHVGHDAGPTSAKTAAKMRKRVLKKILQWVVLGTVFLVLLGSITLVSLLAWYSKDLPSPDSLIEREIAQTTKIYDRTGEHLLYEIHGDQKRTLVKLDDIPEYAKQATILLEDKTFYEHSGLSLSGMIRVVANPVLCKININRFCSAGGSTITQQLVKNAILNNERSVARKLKEIMLTIEIERRYTKDQILQLYFNEIPYGRANYGIESASQNYFGKKVGELTIAEAATLAALPRAPNTYLSNPNQLKSRRDYAIAQLRDNGKITAEESAAAIEAEIKLAPNVSRIEAPHFVLDVVQPALAAQFGTRMVEQGGLKVTTTLDFDKQLIAKDEVEKAYEKNGKAYQFDNAALVALDPKTGQILALIGSKDYFDVEHHGNFDVAVTGLRQPGSSMKPIIYTAAFMKGYTPNTVLWDVETTFPVQPKPYLPHNYDLKERGPVTLRSSLQGSLNIPAVKLMYLVGLERALDFTRELGYTTFNDASSFGLSLVLGGGGVHLLEHTSAYGVFADSGIKHPTVSILKVEDPDGTVLYEWKDNPARVLDENIASTITNVLSDNNARAYVFGATNPLMMPGRPVAAKTGTTNNYVDAWTVGYTSSLVAGVWAGNTDNSPMNNAGGTKAAAPIWNAFMVRALKGTPVEHFATPEPLPETKPVLSAYRVEVPAKEDGTPGDQPKLVLKDGTTISNYGVCTPATVDKASGKLATEFTPATFRETRFFCEVHEILHYLQKDDPLGPPPENPAADPMYAAWEDGITKWLTAPGREVTLSPPPTEHDDSHRPEDRPTVALSSPQPFELIPARFINFGATASAPRSLSRIEYWIDNAKIGESTTYPYNFSGVIPNRIGPGRHTARAVAYDILDNNNEASTEITITADIIPIPLTITAPVSGVKIKTTKFPLDFKVNVGGSLVALDLLYTLEGQSETFYGSTLKPTPVTTVTWGTAPAKGTYSVRMRGREEGDVYHFSAPITVIVQ